MTARLDITNIRKDFPLLQGNDLVYLDNSATSQKPYSVIQAVTDFYEQANANPLRGLYELSQTATDLYEGARENVQHFIHARSPKEIIFTRNATESLNLVAYSYTQAFLQPGDEILVSIMEHHSDMLPWQQAAARCKAIVKYLPCDPSGTITEEAFRAALTDRTKLVAITQISNVLGVENDIRTFAKICHKKGIRIVADGAQSVAHIPVDVQDLDVDFFAFSGHKMLGPMGIGVLYGKEECLEQMPPFLTGGEMIDSVRLDGATFAPLPHKFEAGTVNAPGAIGLSKAVDYLKEIGFSRIREQEDALTALAMEKLQDIPFVHLLGSEDPKNHHGILTFTVDGVHPHDVAAILDADHIAVRAGHHCAQPLLHHLGVSSTTRASLMFYNTEEEIIRFTESLKEIRREMGYAE